MRSLARPDNGLRVVQIETGVNRYAEGSALISAGNTRVLCTCSVETGVPPFKRDSGEGWLTAEYSMLPRATHTRNNRERSKVSGRTMEIQRLIGRALRTVLNFKAIPNLTFTIDCDVLQADGGTRTAAITGAWVALRLACNKLIQSGKLDTDPIVSQVAAISLGLVDEKLLLDLDYDEDSRASVDGNVVLLRDSGLVEIQATAEKGSLPLSLLPEYVSLAQNGIQKLFEIQDQSIRSSLS